MSQSKSARRAAGSKPSPIPPEPVLAKELAQAESRVSDVKCILTCVIETLSAAEDDGGWTEGAARAMNVLRSALTQLEEAQEAFDRVLLRIAHEGIPARYKKSTAYVSGQVTP